MGSFSSGVETSLFDPAICDLHIAECSNRASLERGSARNSVERHSRRLNPVGQKVLVRSVSRRKTVADIASGSAKSESTVRSQQRRELPAATGRRGSRGVRSIGSCPPRSRHLGRVHEALPSGWHLRSRNREQNGRSHVLIVCRNQ